MNLSWYNLSFNLLFSCSTFWRNFSLNVLIKFLLYKKSICYSFLEFTLKKQIFAYLNRGVASGGGGVRPPNNCFRTKKVHLIWSYVADLYHIQILQKKWITANKKCF